MSNKIHYQCSNCGAHEQTSAGVGIPEGMFHLGYRAHGDVLYCPDCVKTWKERNGEEYDEQYKDAQHLFAAWWNRQVGCHSQCKEYQLYKEQLSEDRAHRDLQSAGCPDGINEFKTRMGNKKVRVKKKG